MIRTGIGYDIHKLVKGRKLFLGGLQIPSSRGLKGHSDADVVLHALCDALLGAAGMGDIGEYFPDTEQRYKGIASSKIAKSVLALLRKNKHKIVNVDTVIITSALKIADFRIPMRKSIAQVLEISPLCVGLKAKTNNQAGGIQDKAAIACFAVATIT